MGVEALYRRPRTAQQRHPAHAIHPYPAARLGEHAPEPDLGDGHPVHPDAARLRLSRRRTRLGVPARQPDQPGRQRLLARQRLRRTAVEKRQVRAGLPARLRIGRRCTPGPVPLSRLPEILDNPLAAKPGSSIRCQHQTMDFLTKRRI